MSKAETIEGAIHQDLAHDSAVKHVTGVTHSNKRYLTAKQGWGHDLTEEDLGSD